ncbi:MAG: hypothetical protein KY475_27695, partial [Planctomycetes bacterium]|nr:hypothetical protein [Planctomycetota bacterium]
MRKIVDQGCPVGGPGASLLVTALGEVLRDTEPLDCRTVNQRDFGETYGFTMEEIAGFPDLPAPRRRKYEAALAVELQAQREAALNIRENQFVTKVNSVQDLASIGRFRAYGALRWDGAECIVVATEFLATVENAALWARVDELRQRTGA